MSGSAQFGIAGFKAGGAYKASEIQKMTMRANATIADDNAQIAAYQASTAITNGQTDEETSRLQSGQVYGRQRAALAANGVDLGEGSATDILASTQVLANRDALQIHDNALRAAWGYDTDAMNYRNQAALDRAGAATIQPFMSAIGSLLGAAQQSGFSMGNMGSAGGGGDYGGGFADGVASSGASSGADGAGFAALGG